MRALLMLRWFISQLLDLAGRGTRKRKKASLHTKLLERCCQLQLFVWESAKGGKMSESGKDFGQELSDQINDVLSRLQSKELFQSTWDIVAFVIFFTFIGVVLLMALLVLIRCFCCCCDCDSPRSYNKVPRGKVGIDNKGMEP
nr:small integral membrane protein 22 [Anolis sagrei ordinatus]